MFWIIMDVGDMWEEILRFSSYSRPWSISFDIELELGGNWRNLPNTTISNRLSDMLWIIMWCRRFVRRNTDVFLMSYTVLFYVNWYWIGNWIYLKKSFQHNCFQWAIGHVFWIIMWCWCKEKHWGFPYVLLYILQYHLLLNWTLDIFDEIFQTQLFPRAFGHLFWTIKCSKRFVRRNTDDFFVF